MDALRLVFVGCPGGRPGGQLVRSVPPIVAAMGFFMLVLFHQVMGEFGIIIPWVGVDGGGSPPPLVSARAPSATTS